jgi:coatomer protein complex subunit alpha (xenin)
MNVAYELGDDAWRQLGIEALRQGNHEVVEMAYQKTKEFERLSFLYLLTGNTDKLRKMLKIAEMRGDVMSRFHNALFLGDAEERVRVLESTGQLSLAYITAASHGLNADVERLHGLLTGAHIPIPDVGKGGILLQPPTAIFRGDNWPLLAVTKSALSDIPASSSSSGGVRSSLAASGDEDDGEKANWGDEDDLFDDEEEAEGRRKAIVAAKSAVAEGQKKGWNPDDDLDLSDDEAAAPSVDKGWANSSDSFIAPQGGTSPSVTWCAESTHAADHLCAGSAETALNLLNRQIAAADVSSMRSSALSLFLGASSYLPGIPLSPPNRSYLMRDGGKPASGKPMPALSMKVTPLLDVLKQAYRSFTGGQFGECKSALAQILASIPLVAASSRSDTNDLKELLDVAREYMTAVRLKAALDEANTSGESSAVRSLELSAYFTHCNLQPSHLMLALKTAMANAFKAKNFINAASFARRLLELPDMNSERNADSRSKAQKVLQKSEQQGRNEFTIAYDEMNPFSLDCLNLKPIYKGSPLVKCPYCFSAYAPELKGSLCVTCGISVIGIDAIGLVTQTRAK